MHEAPATKRPCLRRAVEQHPERARRSCRSWRRAHLVNRAHDGVDDGNARRVARDPRIQDGEVTQVGDLVSAHGQGADPGLPQARGGAPIRRARIQDHEIGMRAKHRFHVGAYPIAEVRHRFGRWRIVIPVGPPHNARSRAGGEQKLGDDRIERNDPECRRDAH